ncbi:MAG: hypothetical protein ACRDSL_24945 [Pseudonocardiaceae bacterium]
MGEVPAHLHRFQQFFRGEQMPWRGAKCFGDPICADCLHLAQFIDRRGSLTQ